MDWLQNMRFLLYREEYKAHLNDLDELVFFTLKENGKSDKITKLAKAKWDYNFEYQNKNYPFSFFSSRKLQECDLKALANKEVREKMSTDRTLKLACSMDLINPKVLVGKTNLDCIIVLFSFWEKGEEKIVDYSKNVVMKKKDYFELFEFSLYNKLDKYDLYRIFEFMKDSDCFSLQPLFLIFSKEMLSDLGKNYPRFINQYGRDGINMRNYILFSDDLFMSPCDIQNEPFHNTRARIDAVTLNPMEETPFVCYDEEKNRYLYFDEEFGGFLFQLFSDYVAFEEQKILLSQERYGDCHLNAVRYTDYFFKEYYPFIKMVTLVSGKVQKNEIDAYYHSWVEVYINQTIYVLDYNENLIMKQEDYYKLYGVEVISRMDYSQVNENLNYLKTIWGKYYFPCQFNYFGNELVRDLKRNKHLFKEMQE